MSLNWVTDLNVIEKEKPQAKALLAALEFNSGKKYADFNASTVEEAVHMTVGHPIDVNGAYIIVPPQYDKDTIDDRIRAQLDQVARSYPMFDGFSSTARLQADESGDGTRFFVTYPTNGAKITYPGTKQPIELDISKSMPVDKRADADYEATRPAPGAPGLQ